MPKTFWKPPLTIVLVTLYFPAVVVVMTGVPLFNAVHQMAFGYPASAETSWGKLGNAIWLPSVIAIMAAAASIAIAETLWILWLLLRHLAL
ncbi:MAG: hypothetical protein AB7K64_01505 [Variibacter sp.]